MSSRRHPVEPRDRPSSPTSEPNKGPVSHPLLFFGDFSKFSEEEICLIVLHNLTAFAQGNDEIIDQMTPSDFHLVRDNYLKVYFHDEDSWRRLYDADMFVWEVPADLPTTSSSLTSAPEFPQDAAEGSTSTAVGVPAAEGSSSTDAAAPLSIEVKYKYPGDQHKMKQAPPPPSLFVLIPGVITRLAEKNQLSQEVFISTFLAPVFPEGTSFTAFSIPGRYRAIPPPW